MKSYIERYKYVLVTILSSLVTFVKSYFFMDLLSKKELGYIALFQSMILIVSFFQIGVIYGGYRLISFSLMRMKKANDIIMSYLFALFLFFSLSLLIISFFFPINWFWIAGLIVGLLSLLGNWISSMHIALGRTNKLSFITLISIILSFIALPLLYTQPVLGAVALIALQPFFLVLFSYILNKDFKFKIDFRNKLYFRLILKLGFIPFLTGVMHYVNLQIERWVIGFDLGIAALGDYYLVFLYVSLFAVIPGVLGSLNFPKFMKSLSQKYNNKGLIEIFKVYCIEIILYLIAIGIGTFFIMPKLIEIFLPTHVNGVKYVQIVFYGLVIFTLTDPISYMINAKLHYKYLLSIYIISLVVSMLCYSFLYFSKLGSLVNYSYVNVIFYVTISLGYMFYLVRSWAKDFVYK